MLELPAWLDSKIEIEGNCPNCNAKMNRDYLTAFGLSQAHACPEVTVCFIEYNCRLCQTVSRIEMMEYSIKQLYNDIKGSFESGETSGKVEVAKIIPQKSKITDREVDEAKRTISNTDFWEDLLVDFGLTREDFQKYILDGKILDGKNKCH
jgi:uncharacterized protein (UPF0335 family)